MITRRINSCDPLSGYHRQTPAHVYGWTACKRLSSSAFSEEEPDPQRHCVVHPRPRWRRWQSWNDSIQPPKSQAWMWLRPLHFGGMSSSNENRPCELSLERLHHGCEKPSRESCGGARHRFFSCLLICLCFSPFLSSRLVNRWVILKMCTSLQFIHL